MLKLFTALPPEKAKIAAAMEDYIKKLIGGELLPTLFKEEWKGYRFSPGFSPVVAQRVYDDMKVEKDTVLIGSYPKTGEEVPSILVGKLDTFTVIKSSILFQGTNWFAEIVKEILYGHDEDLCQLSKMIPLPLQFLETWEPDKVELFEHIALPRKMFTTHLPEELVNFEKMKKSKAKIIIIVRNPKDQAVSWYHFCQSNSAFDPIRDQLSSDWNQFFSDYIQGKHPTISKQGQWYPDYLLGWNKHRGDKNVMFACFEDMKKDPKAEIIKLANFLGVDLTENRATEIALSTSFSKMKTNQDSTDGLRQETLKKMGIVRKGQVGSWKEKFTVAQSELMDKAIEEKLGGDAGFNFVYEL